VAFGLGGAVGSSSNRMNGDQIDELRITNGAARYPSDDGFPVPTAAFPRTGTLAPMALLPPLIYGEPAEDNVLTVNVGTWANSPSYSYQWYRNDVAIGGATSATYTVVTADIGTVLTCGVTGTNGSGANEAVSDPTVTVTATGTDPFFSYVTYLAGFNGTNGDTTYSEEKNTAVHTFGANADLSSAVVKFGATSFRGTSTSNAGATVPNSSNFILPGDFTIDVEFYGLATSAMFICGVYDTTGNRAWELLTTSSSAIAFRISNDGSSSAYAYVELTATGMTLSATWNHVRICRHGTTIRLFVNGTLASSSPFYGMFSSTAVLGVGRRSASTTSCYNGYIEELRITKGIARSPTDASFTRPAAAYPRS